MLGLIYVARRLYHSINIQQRTLQIIPPTSHTQTNMPISCHFCKTTHNVEPLRNGEEEMLRVLLENKTSKSYFCDNLCYFRFKQRFHPDGYQARTKKQLEYDMELQKSHPSWRSIPWMENAYTKSLTMTHDGLVILQREEEIVTEFMERSRQEEQQRRFTDARSTDDAQHAHDYEEYADTRREIEV